MVGLPRQPRFQCVHLPADRSGHPAGVPTRFSGVHGGNHWHVEEFGQRDSRMGGQPVMGVDDVGHHVSRSFNPVRVMACPIARVQAIMSGPNSNSCGSCAAARTRTPSRFSSAVGWLTASVLEGLPRQHHHLVAVGGQGGRELVDVATETADDHRRVLPRHHEDLHGAAADSRPVTGAAAARRARRTARRPGSSPRRGAPPRPCGLRQALRRSRGWRARAGAPGNGRNPRRSPC